VNAKQIARIIEVLFQGDAGEHPEPLNKRFQWKDPKTGKSPERPPREMLPTEQDMRDLDATHEIPPGHEPGSVHPGALAPQARPTGDTLPDDRTGKYSMNDLIPKGEMATIDALLDRYLQIQKTHGPEAAKAWFDMYRSAEFESALRRMVDAILG